MATKLFINDQEYCDVTVTKHTAPRQGPSVRIPVLGGNSLTAPGRSYPGQITFQPAKSVILNPHDSHELRDEEGASIEIHITRSHMGSGGFSVEAIYE